MDQSILREKVRKIKESETKHQLLKSSTVGQQRILSSYTKQQDKDRDASLKAVSEKRFG